MKLAKRLGGLVGVLDTLPVGTVIQSEKGNFLYANNVAMKQFGSSSFGDLEQKISGSFKSEVNFADEKGKKLLPEQLPGRIVLKTKKPCKMLVYYTDFKTNKSYWLQIKSIPMFDEKNKFIAVVSVFHDYSEIKSSHDSLKIINKILGNVASITPFKKRLKEFTQLVIPLFADWCFIYIMNNGELQGPVESHRRMSNKKDDEMYKEIFLSNCRPHVKEVINKGKEKFIKRLKLAKNTPKRVKNERLSGTYKFVSMVVTPIKARDKVLGAVVYLRHKPGKDYSRPAASFLTSLSAEISILVDNARLYDKTKNSLLYEKELTKKLFESQQTLNFALEAGKMTIWEWNIKTDDFIWHSEEGNKGKNRGNYRASQKDFLKLIHPDDIYKFTKALDTSTQELKNINIIFRLSNQNKTYRWFHMDGMLLLDGRGKPNRFVGVLSDVTRQKRIVDRLRESEKKFRLAVNSAMDSIILYDNQTGNIVDVNKSSCFLFAKPRSRLVTMNIKKIFGVFPSKEKGEISIKDKTKTLEYTQTFNFLNNMNLLFIRDITDRKIEEKRREHFLGVVSHELKNSLTSINANVEILRNALPKSNCKKVKYNLEMIGDSSGMLNTLINDLLDVTRIRQHRLLFSYEFFNFDELVKEVIRIKRSSNRHKIIYNSAGKAEVLADRNRIKQVVFNLIDNAIKYSPNAKVVEVTSRKEKKYVNLTIKDYGIGISSRERKNIFELYQRGKSPGKFEGLGIGLYISKEIVKRHGGKILLTSKKGHGSEFTIRLPYKPRIRKRITKEREYINLL